VSLIRQTVSGLLTASLYHSSFTKESLEIRVIPVLIYRSFSVANRIPATSGWVLATCFSLATAFELSCIQNMSSSVYISLKSTLLSSSIT